MIFKIVRRSMKKKLGLVFAISILIILSSFFVGLNFFTYKSLDYDYTQMTDVSNVEDFRLYQVGSLYKNYTQELMDKVETDENVQLELKETLYYNQKEEGNISYEINRYSGNEQINKMILEEGKLPENSNEIIVLPEFLVDNNLKIGDTISIAGTDYVISGSAYFSDYIVAADYMHGMIAPDFTKFAPIYMNSDSFDSIDTSNDKISGYEYYSGKFNNELSQEDQKKVYDDIKDSYTISIPVVDENGIPQVDKNYTVITKDISLFPVALDYEYNTALSGVEHEVNGSSSAFTTLSIVLTILTIFLVIILINSVFKSQRREMGILKAEGVSIDKLTFGFGIFVTILVVVNSLIGFLLSLPGSNGFLKIYATYYSIYYYPIQKIVYFDVVKTLSIIAILIIVLTTIISIRKNLNEKTLNLIKNVDSEKLPKKNVFSKVKGMSFTLRVQINILLRNFSKSVLLFFGVSISAFLLLLGTLMYTSVNGMINSTYSDVFTYEYDAKLSSGKSMDESANTYISNTLQIVDVSNGADVKDDASVSVNAYSYDYNEYFNLTNQKGKPLDDKTGATATEGFMKKYNLSIGDTVTVVNPYDVSKNVDIKIVATTNDFFVPTLYMDLDMFQQVFELGNDYTNAVSGVGDYQYIYDIDPDASVYKSEDLAIQMGDSLRIFMIAILIVMILASVIAYISLTAITSVIIDSNRKTISVMKVLGYTTKEISNMTVGIYKWFVIVIYVAMMPVLQFIIQQIVNQAMKDMDFTITIHINYLIGSLGLLIIWLVYMLSYKTSMRRINKVSLAESVKADE